MSGRSNLLLYSRRLKSERSDFGRSKNGSVVKQFSFQMLLSVWNRNFITSKWNKKFGFKTDGTKPNIWFGPNCLKSQLFCSVWSQMSEIWTFLFSLVPMSEIGMFGWVPTVWNPNFFVWFGLNCLKSELFHSVWSQLSEIWMFENWTISAKKLGPKRSKSEHAEIRISKSSDFGTPLFWAKTSKLSFCLIQCFPTF